MVAPLFSLFSGVLCRTLVFVFVTSRGLKTFIKPGAPSR